MLTREPAVNRAHDRITAADFANPPIGSRPGAFWDWLNGAITKEQITRDLEAMKHGGMKGGEIWDVAAHEDPDHRVPAGPAFFGPESLELIAHAIEEADRLKLEIGLVASSGWNAGGAWIPPKHAGKGLYHTVTVIDGPGVVETRLPMPALPEQCPRDKNGHPLYFKEVAVLAVPADKKTMISDIGQVIELSDKLNADGVLEWTAPEGNWSVIRFVCLNHGQQLIVPSPNSGGPMIDFFDPRATEFHLDYMVSRLLKEIGKSTFRGTSFKTMEYDSMELDGFTPWSDRMASAFERRVGYSAIKYLPLLCGWELEDKDANERFLYDWKKFVSDQLIDSHYVTSREFLNRYGVQLIAESGGPGPPIWESNPVDGIKALGAVDIPRGEFWIQTNGIFLIKEIASASHVYGKRLTDAEAFTTWRRWVDGPLNHKELADRALCEGLNNFSFHTFASSPPEAGLPGWAYHAGTDINPTATWWPMVRGLTDYLARCSYMLRQGWFVADACYYYGDQAPNFYPPLATPEEHPLLDNLHPGYDYDVCSSEVILKRMSVKDGRIMLPDGMSYPVLILPDQNHIPVPVLQRILELIKDGATVIANQRPTRAPGLNEPDQKDHAIGEMVQELWGTHKTPSDGQALVIREIGNGRFVITADRTAAVKHIGITEDFKIAGRETHDLGPYDFIHRRTSDKDFYFIRNKTREEQSFTCRFRVSAKESGMSPEFWWPHTGERTACPSWKPVENGCIELPVKLAPLGSVFVVFGKAESDNDKMPLSPLARDTFAASTSPGQVTLDGPWQVNFPEGWGAPESTTFDQLHCWTKSENDDIRFFSGIATYRKTFQAPETGAKESSYFLQLNNLAEIAEVTLNGENLGLVWLPPYRIDISSALKPGKNTLEIRVANLWANRLNGDSLLPESERFTRSNLDRIQTDPTSDSSYGQVPKGETRPIYTTIPPLMKSGLLGPVQIVTPE